MIDYPVVFRCSECAIEAPSLDLLESHIWSRHLRNFPYRCSLCGYPALKHSLLMTHFEEHHFGAQTIEFKRKIGDEVRLRDIIASSIVVPIYEEDDEDTTYEQQVPVQQRNNSQNLDDSLQNQCSMEPMQVLDSGQVHGRNNQLLENEPAVGSLVYMDVKPSIHNYGKVEIMQDHDGNPLQMIEEMPSHSQDIVHTMDDPNDLMEDEDGFIYGGHEMLDEYEYVDEDGGAVFVSDQYPTTSTHTRNIRMRVLKERHLDFVVDQVAHPGKKKTTTIWECPECGKVVRYPSRIDEHRRSHTGEKPFHCEICGQRFAQKGALKCHKRLHTGERPYACSWDCGKAFVSASAQRMHEKQHSGERPYGCQFCGRCFTKRSHQIRHENAVHHSLSIEPRRSQARGLDAAGTHEPILKGIVEGVVEEVQLDRFERAMRREGGVLVG